MGYRTVVIFNNDLAHEWEKDTELGRKIFLSTHGLQHFTYGRVVECCHADIQTLGILDGLHFTPITFGSWNSTETPVDTEVKLLKEAADKLGYKLVKKSQKKDQ